MKNKLPKAHYESTPIVRVSESGKFTFEIVLERLEKVLWILSVELAILMVLLIIK